jgi:hypothetical protein
VHEHGSEAVGLSIYASSDLRTPQPGVPVRSYCPDLPAAGDAILVFDLGVGLRDVPVWVELKEMTRPEPRTVTRVPPATYPFRVVQVPARFEVPGEYQVIVGFEPRSGAPRGAPDPALRFPLRVGRQRTGWLWILALASLGVLSAAFAGYAGMPRPKAVIVATRRSPAMRRHIRTQTIGCASMTKIDFTPYPATFGLMGGTHGSDRARGSS